MKLFMDFKSAVLISINCQQYCHCLIVFLFIGFLVIGFMTVTSI